MALMGKLAHSRGRVGRLGWTAVVLFAVASCSCDAAPDESDSAAATSGGTGGAAATANTGASSSSTSTSSTGGGAAWEPVGWNHGCDSGVEVALPEVAQSLLPPLEWEPCSASVPCEKWKVNFTPMLPTPVTHARIHRERGETQVGVYLNEETHLIAAVYHLLERTPVIGWRTLQLQCPLTPATPVGPGVWIGVQEISDSGDYAWFAYHALADASVEPVPFLESDVALDTIGSPTHFLVWTFGKQLIAWRRPDGARQELTTTGVADSSPTITTHGVFFKHHPQTGVSEVWHWDPATGQSQKAVQLPAGTGAVHVIANDERLWWTVGTLDPNGIGFVKIELYTTELPLTGPVPATGAFLADLDLDIADAVASSDRFVYHDSIDKLFRIVDLTGQETVVPIPAEAVNAQNVAFTGDDGEVANSLWFSSGKGMFRLSLP